MVSGCAAFNSRIVGSGYFQGVRCDYNEMFHPETFDPQCRINPALAAVDMPFSFVGDILFMPNDIYYSREKSGKPKLFAPDFHASGFEDANDAKACFDSYNQVFVVRILEDYWEDRGPHKFALHHYKATVAKCYKGKWNVGETLAFTTALDGRAPNETNVCAGSDMLLLSNKRAKKELTFDTGVYFAADTNLQLILQSVFKR